MIRRWYNSWGSTPHEVDAPLVDDDLVPDPMWVATHSVDIEAPPEDVWPWLLQIGHDRGGFYSYDWLERLFGFGTHNADDINPAWQDLQQGGSVLTMPLIGPPCKVARLDPPKAITLVLGTRFLDECRGTMDWCEAVSWLFLLEPSAPGRTRMNVRVRARWQGLIGWLAFRMGMEPAHAIMQTGMNRGLKKRVEAKRAASRVVAGS